MLHSSEFCRSPVVARRSDSVPRVGCHPISRVTELSLAYTHLSYANFMPISKAHVAQTCGRSAYSSSWQVFTCAYDALSLSRQSKPQTPQRPCCFPFNAQEGLFDSFAWIVITSSAASRGDFRGRTPYARDVYMQNVVFGDSSAAAPEPTFTCPDSLLSNPKKAEGIAVNSGSRAPQESMNRLSDTLSGAAAVSS